MDERTGWTPVEESLPGTFPLIVIVSTPGEGVLPHMVAVKNLPLFLEQQSAFSFAIPVGKEKEVARNLSLPAAASFNDGGQTITAFDTHELANGHQLVTVTATFNGEAMTTARYEASGAQHHPLLIKHWNYRYRGPLIVLWSMVLTGSLLSLILLGEWVWTRAQKSAVPDATLPGD